MRSTSSSASTGTRAPACGSLTGGKNRFGAEGESAWFEMRPDGLHPIDPTGLLVSGERVAGAAAALPQSGRRALAVEVQALVGTAEGSGRRQATGLDLRRFQLVAAVLERAAGIPLGRRSSSAPPREGPGRRPRLRPGRGRRARLRGLRRAVPAGSAFVGEVALTGLLRPAPGLDSVWQPPARRGSPPSSSRLLASAAGQGPTRGSAWSRSAISRTPSDGSSRLWKTPRPARSA